MQPIVIVSFIIIIIIPPRLTNTALTALSLFMKLTTAVEADAKLTENKYCTDWAEGGAIATVQKCKL
jgi:hypothetical protein